jgi:hypothetical protein
MTTVFGRKKEPQLEPQRGLVVQRVLPDVVPK